MTMLIRELTEQIECITEAAEDGKRNYFVEGIIMQSAIKNRNGRVYPKETMMNELTRYNTEYVNKNRALGELGHPASVSINLDRVSHMFTELRQDGNNVVGRAKILETPMGNIVKGLIDGGAQLGISSRGMGSIKQNSQGIMEVQSDFRLTTAGDIVSDPSAPDAFIKGIMEGVEWVYDIASSSWVMQNTFDKIEETVKKSNKIDESTALKLFTNFIENL